MNTTMYQPPPYMPMEVFKSLPEGISAQLIENLIVMEPPPVYIHQDISAALGNAIYNFVKRRGLGKVLFAPVGVYLGKENAFQPDILFLSNERAHIIRKNGLHGAPDLVVEILSPSTERYDREDKMKVYERFGVKEYWLVDPETHSVEGYQLINSAFAALSPARGIIHSKLLGTKFRF